MEFSCKRCGYTTNSKGNLVKHFQRKTTCQPLHSDQSYEALLLELTAKTFVGLKCEHCGKLLKSPSSKCRHKKICIKNPDSSKYARHLEDKIDVLVQLIDRQQQDIDKLKHQTSSTTQIFHNTNNGTINNITINAFGKEDISYLTKHHNFPAFMVKCIKEKIDGVCQLIVRKHFDPKHPENHNIKKNNRKDDFMECYDGRKWKPRYSQDVLDDLFINLQTDFANFVDQAISDNGLIKKLWLDNFMKHVGAPLEWDLANSNYDFEDDERADDKQSAKNKIYKLACEYIYRHSKTIN